MNVRLPRDASGFQDCAKVHVAKKYVFLNGEFKYRSSKRDSGFLDLDDSCANLDGPGELDCSSAVLSILVREQQRSTNKSNVVAAFA